MYVIIIHQRYRRTGGETNGQTTYRVASRGKTRRQAVARIADRTATQQTHVRSYAKNCRGHVT